ERGHAYRRQHVSHVDLRIHLRQRHSRARTRAHSQVRGPPVAKLRVVSHTRRALVDADWSTPLLAHHFEKVFALFERRSPRILGIANPLSVRANHHERQRLLRIRRREQTAHWATFRHADQRRTLRTNRIHHRAHVVHPLLECRQLIDGNAIGKSRASFVKKYQTRKRRESQQEARKAR